MEKIRLLKAAEIECKVKKVMAGGAILLLYKTARTDMDVLDETFGPMNWTDDYKEIKGNLYCGIGVKDGGDFVWKWDCGIESREDGEGNEKKGEASDAFKRAGFRWGIGRELYTAPFIFVRSDAMNIEKDGSRYKTNDSFTVDAIGYDNNRAISMLVIVNNKTKKQCYTFGTKAPEKPREFRKVTDIPHCLDCGKEISPVTAKDGSKIPVNEVLDLGLKRFGRFLCGDCMKKANDKG